MKAGHLPNLNRHNASLALGKQASLHHHMALNTPIHTRECKEFCPSELTSLSEDSPMQAAVARNWHLQGHLTESEAKASLPKVS